MTEIREPLAYARWFGKLRDRRAKARIELVFVVYLWEILVM